MSAKRKTKYTDYERWVGLPHYMLKAPAWRTMTPNGKALLIDVWQRFNGMNNGEIGYSVREAADIGLHRNSASRAFDELIGRGFLIVTRQAAFTMKTRESRTYRVTALPVGDSAATKEFMRWTPPTMAPKSRTRSLSRASQSPHRDREPSNATILPLTVPPQGPSTPEAPPPRSLHRDTSNYHGDMEARGGRSGAQPPASAAPRTPHDDADDNCLLPVGTLVSTMMAQHSSAASRPAAPPSSGGIPAVMANGDTATVKIVRRGVVTREQRNAGFREFQERAAGRAAKRRRPSPARTAT